MQLKENGEMENTCQGCIMLFSVCQKLSNLCLNICVSPLPLAFVWVVHIAALKKGNITCCSVLGFFYALICWNMHVLFFFFSQVRAMLYPTLICFGWRRPHTPRWQNECCHGNLLPGNPNSLATSQTVAMAQLSIYIFWYCVWSFRAPPFQSFQSNAWRKNRS